MSIDSKTLSLVWSNLLKFLESQEQSRDKLISSFSCVPADSVLDIMSNIWFDLKNILGKNIMSVGEWVPILANILSENGANVIAVDPLYTLWTDLLYDRTKQPFDSADLMFSDEAFLNFLKNTTIGVQSKIMYDLVSLWKDWFNQKLFNSKVTFNDSSGDFIAWVDDHSQDVVMLPFTLNNLNSDDVFDVLCWSIEKLKPWGDLIIVGPELMIQENRSFSSDYKFLLQKYWNNAKTTQVFDDQLYIWLRFTKS